MVEPKKLKVAELREELKNRGLDSKGNKAQLVKRLEKALKQETGELDESHNETLESSVLESSTLETSTEEHDESLVHERPGLSPDKKVTRALVQQKEEERTEVLLQGQEEVDIQEQDEQQEPTSNFQEPMPIEAAEEPQAMDDEEPQPVTKDEQQPVITKVPQPLDTEEPQPLDTDEPQTLDTEEPQPLDTEEPQPMDNEDPLPEKVEQKPEILEEVKEEASIKMAEPEEEYEKQEEPQVVKEEAKREAHPSTLEEEQQQAVLEPKTELNVTEENGDVKNESPVEAADEKTESPVKAAAEEVMEVATEAKESLPEIDSVAEAENQTSEGKDVERDSRKRRRSRSRSRSRERHHRPRHSRSRSPRRQRSRSRDRKRSGSREKRPRSGSREKRHSPDRQRRRDRSRSPRRRVSRFDSPHTKPKDPEENEDWIIATNVQWDRFNCDLHMRISEDGYKCNPITVEGFAFMWAGVRSNYGFTKGKVAFECKILEHLNVNHLPEEETSRHVVRVGYSTDDTSMQLGEEKFSYGYGGTGKASTDCKFTDYGTKFGQGDVISCYLNFEPDNIEISYSKNGEDLGVCYEVEKNELNERALFAHVLTKNCEFDVNFGQKQEPYFPLKEGYAWIGDIAEADRVRGTLPPSKKEDCEIIMMCGLPGAGKTVWATKYFQEHREQRYHVLGTNNIIDKMKVMGLPRKRNYAGRWDILIDKSTKCLNRLLEIASKKKRNYILDQTNVYPSAQRRKMRPFEGFQRRAVVIVPDDEEFKRRCEKREKEEGKEIPDIAVWEMKANFRLPEEGQNFDKVEFIELDRDDASKVVEKYNKEGEENLPPDYLRFRYDNRGSSYGQHGGGGGGGGNRYGGKKCFVVTETGETMVETVMVVTEVVVAMIGEITEIEDEEVDGGEIVEGTWGTLQMIDRGTPTKITEIATSLTIKITVVEGVAVTITTAVVEEVVTATTPATNNITTAVTAPLTIVHGATSREVGTTASSRVAGAIRAAGVTRDGATKHTARAGDNSGETINSPLRGSSQQIPQLSNGRTTTTSTSTLSKVAGVITAMDTTSKVLLTKVPSNNNRSSSQQFRNSPCLNVLYLYIHVL